MFRQSGPKSSKCWKSYRMDIFEAKRVPKMIKDVKLNILHKDYLRFWYSSILISKTQNFDFQKWIPIKSKICIGFVKNRIYVINVHTNNTHTTLQSRQRYDSESNHEPIQNQMFFAWVRVDLNRKMGKHIESWVNLYQYLGNTLESWIDSESIPGKPLESWVK